MLVGVVALSFQPREASLLVRPAILASSSLTERLRFKE